MGFEWNVKRKARAIAAPVVFLTLTGYFGWNAIQGDRGLLAQSDRKKLLSLVVLANDAARSDRDAWERRVAGLRSNRLNPDTLDERARAMLNLADPNDVVVQYPPKDRLF